MPTKEENIHLVAAGPKRCCSCKNDRPCDCGCVCEDMTNLDDSGNTPTTSKQPNPNEDCYKAMQFNDYTYADDPGQPTCQDPYEEPFIGPKAPCWMFVAKDCGDHQKCTEEEALTMCDNPTESIDCDGEVIPVLRCYECPCDCEFVGRQLQQAIFNTYDECNEYLAARASGEIGDSDDGPMCDKCVEGDFPQGDHGSVCDDLRNNHINCAGNSSCIGQQEGDKCYYVVPLVCSDYGPDCTLTNNPAPPFDTPCDPDEECNPECWHRAACADPIYGVDMDEEHVLEFSALQNCEAYLEAKWEDGAICERCVKWSKYSYCWMIAPYTCYDFGCSNLYQTSCAGACGDPYSLNYNSTHTGKADFLPEGTDYELGKTGDAVCLDADGNEVSRGPDPIQCTGYETPYKGQMQLKLEKCGLKCASEGVGLITPPASRPLYKTVTIKSSSKSGGKGQSFSSWKQTRTGGGCCDCEGKCASAGDSCTHSYSNEYSDTRTSVINLTCVSLPVPSDGQPNSGFSVGQWTQTHSYTRTNSRAYSCSYSGGCYYAGQPQSCGDISPYNYSNTKTTTTTGPFGGVANPTPYQSYDPVAAWGHFVPSISCVDCDFIRTECPKLNEDDVWTQDVMCDDELQAGTQSHSLICTAPKWSYSASPTNFTASYTGDSCSSSDSYSATCPVYGGCWDNWPYGFRDWCGGTNSDSSSSSGNSYGTDQELTVTLSNPMTAEENPSWLPGWAQSGFRAMDELNPDNSIYSESQSTIGSTPHVQGLVWYDCTIWCQSNCNITVSGGGSSFNIPGTREFQPCGGPYADGSSFYFGDWFHPNTVVSCDAKSAVGGEARCDISCCPTARDITTDP